MAKFEMDGLAKSDLYSQLTRAWFDRRLTKANIKPRDAAKEAREFLDALCEEGETQPAGDKS